MLQPLTSHDLEDVKVGGGAGKTEAGSARDNNLGIAASAESNICEITYNGSALARSYLEAVYDVVHQSSQYF